MGRTNPTFRNRIQSIEQEWKPFRRGLRKHEQAYFDLCFSHAYARADAAGYQNPIDPWPALLLSIVIEQQRQIEELTVHFDATSLPE